MAAQIAQRGFPNRNLCNLWKSVDLLASDLIEYNDAAPPILNLSFSTLPSKPTVAANPFSPTFPREHLRQISFASKPNRITQSVRKGGR
jgi:hypothetical protein